MELITIGITAFNAAETVSRAVNSACAQDWPTLEIIIVDDASTDDTRAVIQNLPAGAHPVRLIVHEENQGVAAARNSIIREAKGAYIAFFDDDDESDAGRVRMQYEAMRAYEGVHACPAGLVCHTARRQIYPDGTTRLERALGTVGDGSAAPHGEMLVARMVQGETGGNDALLGSSATCSQMARTALYRAHGGFDRAFRRCEDSEFALRLARDGAHFLGMAAPLVTQFMTRAPDKNMDLERDYTKRLYQKHADAAPASYAPFLFAWLDVKYDFLSRRYMRFAWRLAVLLLKHPVWAARRMIHAWPNLRFNRLTTRFYRGGHG